MRDAKFIRPFASVVDAFHAGAIAGFRVTVTIVSAPAAEPVLDGTMAGLTRARDSIAA